MSERIGTLIEHMPRESKGHSKGNKPYKAKGGDAYGRRRDNRGKDFNNDDRW